MDSRGTTRRGARVTTSQDSAIQHRLLLDGFGFDVYGVYAVCSALNWLVRDAVPGDR